MNVTAPVEVKMRRIAATDNAAIASVIRQVSAEYGLTADKGYTVADPELDELYQLYSREGCAYWVVELNGDVVGGGGVAPLKCSEPDICELLALMAIDHAKKSGFTRCYLETTAFLTDAIGLYEHLGFAHIEGPLGCTGHVDCEVRMLKTL